MISRDSTKLCLFPVPMQVVVWRRYNDIKRLYKALSYLHQTLHRKEEFPPFSRSKVFGKLC